MAFGVLDLLVFERNGAKLDIQITEGDFHLQQDGFLAFHGSTIDSALGIARREPPIPVALAAKRYLERFNLTLDLMKLDDQSASDFRFIFERNRDSVISHSDTFSHARRYAKRGPEWLIYVNLFVYRRLNLRSEGVTLEEFQESQPENSSRKAVLVVRTPNRVFNKPQEMLDLYQGSEIKPPIPNPLPLAYQVLHIVELEDNLVE